MFDLPVITREERKEATEFRKFLMKRGFAMAQYSVYYRLLSGKEAVEAETGKLRKGLPSKGKVDIITITDRQYEDMVSFTGSKRDPPKKTPSQLVLF